LICVGDTKYNGAVTLFMVTETPASDFGSGTAEAEAVCGARFVPKIDISIPGAAPAENDAPFTIPPTLIVGPVFGVT
jgi:hypothetical protein